METATRVTSWREFEGTDDERHYSQLYDADGFAILTLVVNPAEVAGLDLREAAVKLVDNLPK